MNNTGLRRFGFGLLLLAVIVQSGCTMIAMSKRNEMPLGGNNVDAPASFVIEVATPYAKPTIHKETLTKNLTVQGALESAGLLKRFRNMQVTVYRVVPENGQLLKMGCEFQPGKRLIKYEQDYGVLPGDRIVIEPKSSLFETNKKG
jgi:hypothetical protein